MRLFSKGNWNKTFRFLRNVSGEEVVDAESKAIKEYADNLVEQLSAATPRDSGETAKSWTYRIYNDGTKVKLNIYNSNVVDGVCVAILIQYGHATNNGGYVPGVDYINPVVKPVFNKIERKAWMEVIK